jgi:hypothetical protein
MTKKNGLVLALSWAIVGTMVGCGSSSPAQNYCSAKELEASGAALNCVMPDFTEPSTATATSTATGTGGTIPTGGTGGAGGSTATTDTSTATGTTVNPLPEWCNAYAGPGGVTGLSLGNTVISNGNWHFTNATGEWVANCKVDAIGNAICCGTLAAEINNAVSTSLTTWTGMATEKCVFWTPNNGFAPTISGTGYTVSGMQVNLTNSSPLAWRDSSWVKIAGCYGFQD